MALSPGGLHDLVNANGIVNPTAHWHGQLLQIKSRTRLAR